MLGKLFFTIALFNTFVHAVEKDVEERKSVNIKYNQSQGSMAGQNILKTKKRTQVPQNCEHKTSLNNHHTNASKIPRRNRINVLPSRVEIILMRDQKIPSFTPAQLKEIKEVSILCGLKFSHFGVGAPLFVASARKFLEGTINLNTLTVTDDLTDLIFSIPIHTKICLYRHPNTTIYGSWEDVRQKNFSIL